MFCINVFCANSYLKAFDTWGLNEEASNLNKTSIVLGQLKFIFPHLQVLLLRLQQEREAGVVKSRSEMAIINIWTRFLAQLKDAVVNFNNDTAHWDGKLLLCHSGIPCIEIHVLINEQYVMFKYKYSTYK